MVAPTCDLMSSPTIGTPASVNLSAHSLVPHDEDREGVDEGDLGVDGALGVELRRGLGADGQVADQDVDLAVLEDLDHVDRGLGGLLDRQAVVLAQAVQGVAALHGHALVGDVADLDRVVLAGADGVRKVEADLLRVDVERGDELDVTHVVVAELDVHQTGDLGRRVGVLVVLDALHQRGGAVAHADDGYANRTHSGCSLFVLGRGLRDAGLTLQFRRADRAVSDPVPPAHSR